LLIYINSHTADRGIYIYLGLIYYSVIVQKHEEETGWQHKPKQNKR